MNFLHYIRSIRHITVEPVLLLFMTSSFMQIGITQDFLLQKICINSEFSSSCNNLTNSSKEYIHTQTSYWLRYTNLAFSFPAIFSSLYFGSWCGYYGPKLTMLLPCFGTVLGSGINIILAWFMKSHEGYLLISQFVSGILGGSICVIMACTSYLSLVAPVQNRTMRFSILESMIFFGGTMGPFIGGKMVELTSYEAVFGLILGMNCVVIVYVFVRIENIRPGNFKDLQSSVAEEEKGGENENGDRVFLHEQNSYRYSCKSLFSPEHFVDAVVVCFRKRERSKRDFIVLLLLSAVVVMLCTAGEMDTAYLFTRDDPLNWDYPTYSYYNAAKHAVCGSALLFGLPLLRYWKQPRDTTIAILGILSKMAGLMLLAFSSTPVMMYLVPLAAILSSFPMPALRSLLSKLMEPNEHGKLFAFVASAEQVCFLVGSLIFNSLYPNTRSFLPGFVFVFSVCLLIVPLSIVGWMHTLSKRYNIVVLPENNGFSHVDGR